MGHHDNVNWKEILKVLFKRISVGFVLSELIILVSLNFVSVDGLSPTISIYEGLYEMTIFFEDYNEDANRIEPETKWEFVIKDGKLISTDNRLDLTGSTVLTGGFVKIVLDFPGGECHTTGAQILPASPGATKPDYDFSAESDCTYGHIIIESQRISGIFLDKPQDNDESVTADNDESDNQNSDVIGIIVIFTIIVITIIVFLRGYTMKVRHRG